MSNFNNNQPCSIIVRHLVEDAEQAPLSEIWSEMSTDYQLKVSRLIGQYLNEADRAELTGMFSDWVEIVEFLVEKKAPTLKAASFRALKSPINRILNNGLKDELLDVHVIKELLLRLKETRGIAAKDLSQKSTSSKKIKSIKPDELYALRLYSRQNQNSRFAIHWLEFNILTNCRPNEIQEAKLYLPTSLISEPYLQVRNTVKSEKTKSDIKTGVKAEFRRIPLVNCSFHDLCFIDHFLTEYYQFSAEPNFEYDSFYNLQRKRLARAASTVLGKPLALSLGRTQWSANAKAVEMDRSEIATAMGHDTERRATENYGRKSQGWQKVDTRGSTISSRRNSQTYENVGNLGLKNDDYLGIEFNEDEI